MKYLIPISFLFFFFTPTVHAEQAVLVRTEFAEEMTLTYALDNKWTMALFQDYEAYLPESLAKAIEGKNNIILGTQSEMVDYEVEKLRKKKEKEKREELNKIEITLEQAEKIIQMVLNSKVSIK